MSFFNHQNFKFDHPVITMGTFDGVHLGHQKILSELAIRARKSQKKAVVISYYHHPLETIYQNTFPYLLTEISQREKLIHDLGIDCILYLNFTPQMAKMSADDFLKQIIYQNLSPSEIVVGYDTHFGKNREGGYDFLKARESLYNYQVDIVPPYKINGKIVSSSWCRECVRAGAVDQLQNLLGHPYTLTGKVIRGNMIGRQLGFPTANLLWTDQNKLIPKCGIYFSRIHTKYGISQGVTNIGYRPTVIDKSDLTVETHILDFNQNIYGQEITLTFESRIRDEYKLRDRSELIKYITHDVITARKLAAAAKER